MKRLFWINFHCVLFFATWLLFPETGSAIPKGYEVLFVDGFQTNSDRNQLQVLYDKITSVYSQSELTVGDFVDRVDVSEIEQMDREDLAQYDFVVWSKYAGALSKNTTDKMLSLELPIILFDTSKFEYANQLGLTKMIPGQPRLHNTATVAVDAVHRGMYHQTITEMMYSCMLYFHANPGNSLCEDYQKACFMASVDAEIDNTSQTTNQSYASISVDLLSDYTRPLFVATESSDYELDDISLDDRAVIFVNDKKHVIVLGTKELPRNRYWSALAVDYQLKGLDAGHSDQRTQMKTRGDLMHQLLMYAASADTDLASLGGGVQLPGADEELLFSPSGDNLVQQTDMDIPSRGFNFKVTRTYRTGLNNSSSVLGPSWALNHDRELIWDTFSDTIIISDGSGGTEVLEQVSGRSGSADDASGDRRIFVSPMGGNTDLVTYYPEGNDAPETRHSMELDDYCTGRLHETSPAPEAPNQEGFLVRDKRGNLAFFAAHDIANDNVENWCPDGNNWNYSANAAAIWGRQDFRTRGGELKIYKLAYIEDRNGNRQQYFYDYPDGPQGLYDNIYPADEQGRDLEHQREKEKS